MLASGVKANVTIDVSHVTLHGGFTGVNPLLTVTVALFSIKFPGTFNNIILFDIKYGDRPGKVYIAGKYIGIGFQL